MLAGGEGRRLGGADKGLLRFKGEPLMAHVLRALKPQVAECLISANRNLTDYAGFGVPVLPDAAGEGPLAGLATLLAAAQNEWLLCVPCDSPVLPDALAARLLQAAQQAGADAALLHDGEYPHPTFCLVRTHLAADAQSAARRGTGLAAWLHAHQAAALHAAAPENLNTAADFARLEAAA